MNIIVNGSKKTTDKEFLSYNDIVRLAYDPDKRRNAIHSIVYSGGESPKREGMVYPSESVKVTEGMRFSAVVTDQA